MAETDRHWLSIVVVAAMFYAAAGVLTGKLSALAGSDQMKFVWRASAFIISAVIFAAHIIFERWRRHSNGPTTAWHTSLAAALGALGLAIAANLRDAVSPSGYRPRMLIALVAWPALTAVPAFFVALVLAAMLSLRPNNK